MTKPQAWAGERLGLPHKGPGSIAKIGRRLLALAIDWGISMLLARAFFDYSNTAMLAIFFAHSWLFTVTTGSTIGHRCAGLRLKSLNGEWLGLWRPAIRIALILLVIPATIWDADGRGLQDKAAGSVLVRR